MKKKLSALLAMLMALCMVMTLVACGSSSSSSSSTTSSDSTATDDADDAADADDADAADADADADAEADTATSDVTYPTMTIKSATEYNESDLNGAIMAYFASYVEEQSGGAITVQIYYGGSFCADAEAWEYVQSGDLEFAFDQPAYLMSSIPLAFGVASWISNEHAVEVANAVLYDETTGALVAAQAAENNLVLLAHTCAGSSNFFSTVEIPTLDDATAYTVGSPINLDLYAGYGFGTVAVEPSDMYDSLSRGVCDMIAFSAGNYVSMGLVEVAPHVLLQGAHFSNQLVGFNLDFWNSLDEATQDLLREAALAASAWSVEYCNQIDEEMAEIVAEAGGTLYSMTEEEAKEFNYRSMSANCDLMRVYAANLGCEEAMEATIALWAEVLEQPAF